MTIAYRFKIALFLILSIFYLNAEEEQAPADPFNSSLTNTQNLLHSFNNLPVSPISGEWMNHEVDFVVMGPEPIVLSRHYQADGAVNRLGYHWDFNRPHSLLIQKGQKADRKFIQARYVQPSGMKTTHHSKNIKESEFFSLVLAKAHGLVNYRAGEMSARTNLHNTTLYLDEEKSLCTALSGSGEITFFTYNKSGQGLSCYKPQYERKSNGNFFIYDQKKIYAVDSTHQCQFGWIDVQSEHLKTIKVKTSDNRYGLYHFDIYRRTPFRSDASTGAIDPRRNVTPTRYYLSAVDFSHKPSEKYSYIHKSSLTTPIHRDELKAPLLKRKEKPDDRYQEVEYYFQCKNPVDQVAQVDIKDEEDFRMHRIRVLKAPVGTTNEPIVTHRFIYHTTDSKKAKAHEKSAGRTEVYDALLRKKEFIYNESHRPTQVNHYLNGQLYTVEGFAWDEKDIDFFDREEPQKSEKEPKKDKKKKYHPFSHLASLSPLVEKTRFFSNEKQEKSPSLTPSMDRLATFMPHTLSKEFIETNSAHMEDARKLIKNATKHAYLSKQSQGNLLFNYLKGQHDQVIHAQDFTYDENGNVLRERFHGNLTGRCTTPIALEGLPHYINSGVETYNKLFAYQQIKHLNLLVAEYEDNGKGMVYRYQPGTDLVIAKYLTQRDPQTGIDVVRFREFYTYDQNATLICLVKDDGSSFEANDLTNFTERQITYLFPRQQAPYGLPERIDEKYLDPHTHQEVLSKRLICHYSLQGKLIQQDHYDANEAYAYSLYWEYDAHGNITKETNAIGQVIIKAYDANDNLIEQIGPHPQLIKKFSYDFSNRLIQTEERHPDHAEPFITQYRYDYIGNKIAAIDRFGCETRYEYDDLNRLIKTTYSLVYDAAGQVIQPTEEIVYNELDKPVCLIDACGQKTHIAYNSRGQPTAKVYADGSSETFEYYLDGSLFKSKAINGTSTIYHRDFLGRVLAEEFRGVNDEQLGVEYKEYKGFKLIKSIDAEGCVTTYAYDATGRLLQEVCEDACKSYTYDTLGRIATVSQVYGFASEDKVVSCYTYDFLNRVTEESIQDGKGQCLSSKTYAYDEWGNQTQVKQESEAGICITQVIYNSDKKPVKLIDAEGGETTIEYNDQFLNEFESRVLQTKVKDARQTMTTQTYDTLGRLVHLIQQNVAGQILMSQHNFYDATGRPVKTYHHVYVNGQHVRDYNTLQTYHANGQIESITEAEGTPLQKTTRYAYNTYGQKVSILKPDGLRIGQSYDAYGRLEAVASSDATIGYQYFYNRCHQVTEVVDAVLNQSTKRDYNIAGEMTRETLGNGLQLNYAYDRMGRPLTVTLPDRTSIQYRYYATFLKEIERQTPHGNYSHKYMDHDSAGHLLKAQLIKNAGDIHYSYDKMGRTKQIQSPSWTQIVPDGGFDVIGRLIATVTQDAIGINEMLYTYDDLNHLEMERGYFNNDYQSDSIHNRLQKNQIIYQINHLNQIVRQDDQNYTYDLSGNLVKKIQNNKEIHYRYDALNRLIGFHSDEEQVSYTYDAFNRRLSKTCNGQCEKYFYQEQNEIGCTDQNGIIKQLRILNSMNRSEIGGAIALELEGKCYAPIHDRQGHVMALIDAETGQTCETYRYSAFGEEVIFDANGQKVEQSSCGNPWRYACKRSDPETGWVYFGQRYYDKEVGRWTTGDPLWFADGPNLYAYLHHSPLVSFDAYGLLDEANPGTQTSYSSPNSSLPKYERPETSIVESVANAVVDAVSCVREPANAFKEGLANGVINLEGVVINRSCEAAGKCYNYFSTSNTGFSGSPQTQNNKTQEGWLCYGARLAGELSGVAVNIAAAQYVAGTRIAIAGTRAATYVGGKTLQVGCKVASKVSTRLNIFSGTVVKSASGAVAKEAAIGVEVLAQKGLPSIASEISVANNSVTSQIAHIAKEMSTSNFTGISHLSNHATQRLGQRNISTAMVDKAIEKGLPFFDHKEQNIAYVLEKGFASGKTLQVSVNPNTGKIATAIRRSNFNSKIKYNNQSRFTLLEEINGGN